MTFQDCTDPQQNHWYPRFVSDEADALLDGLQPAHVELLRVALKTTTFEEWTLWLEASREEICEYGELTQREQMRRLQMPEKTHAVRLHHACLFVELWRARTTMSFYTFPPYGRVPDTPELQRKMMLGILASHRKAYLLDVWPFGTEDGEAPYPFREPEAGL